MHEVNALSRKQNNIFFLLRHARFFGFTDYRSEMSRPDFLAPLRPRPATPENEDMSRVAHPQTRREPSPTKSRSPVFLDASVPQERATRPIGSLCTRPVRSTQPGSFQTPQMAARTTVTKRVKTTEPVPKLHVKSDRTFGKTVPSSCTYTGT